MKRALIILAYIAWSIPALAVPQAWNVDVSRVQPCQFNAYHGETIELAASFFSRGEPYLVGGETFALFWQTNGMGSAYWTAPASATSNTVSAVFTAAMDPGAPLVYGFIGATGSNYRASFAIRFATSPGAVPNALPLPVPVIDFDKVEVLNPPWATEGDIESALTNYYTIAQTDAAINAAAQVLQGDLASATNAVAQVLQGDLGVAAQAATNYTDSVAGALSTSLAVAAQSATNYTDSAIQALPAWAKAATKPTYTLNEVCPSTENWLGVPGTTSAGKSIKVLAKTVNGVIEGGMTVTGSSNNDNNTTKYRYGGVSTTRNGTATDYLFDTSSQSGIVRRSELAAVAPGDYANVSNRAVHALGSTGDQTLSGGRFTIDYEGPDGDKWLQIQRGLESGLALCFDSLVFGNERYALPLSSGRLALESQIPSGDDWSATNTVAVIARHTGKETVSIPSGGNLVADLSGWNDGVQTFVVLEPSGAYTVASNVEYCGYGTWPTNTALCVAWPYAGTLYVNPITIIRE